MFPAWCLAQGTQEEVLCGRHMHFLTMQTPLFLAGEHDSQNQVVLDVL